MKRDPSDSTKVICSGRKDDAATADQQSHLYRVNQTGSSTATVCLGFESFESFHQNGSNIDPNVLYTYDAVYAAADAIDHLLRSGYSASNITGASLYSYMTSTAAKFGPLSTGNISFSGPGGGIRKTGLAFKLLNYQPSLSSASTSTRGDYSEHGLAFVGEYMDSAGWLLCGRAADEAQMAAYGRSQCSDPVYRTAGGGAEPPQDAPPDQYVTFRSDYSAVLTVFASIGTVPVLASFLVIATTWRKKQIRLLQPRLLAVMCFGAALGLAKVFLAAAAPSDGSCIAQLWLAHLSFVLVFVTMLLRLRRLHKVLNSSSGRCKRVVVSEAHVVGFLAFDAVVVIAILLAISALSNGSLLASYATLSDNQTTRELFCAAPKHLGAALLTSVLYILEAVCIVAALWYTYLTRDVPAAINASLTPGKIETTRLTKFTDLMEYRQTTYLDNTP
jgi:cytochrome b561